MELGVSLNWFFFFLVLDVAGMAIFRTQLRLRICKIWNQFETLIVSKKIQEDVIAAGLIKKILNNDIGLDFVELAWAAPLLLQALFLLKTPKYTRANS